MVALRWPGGGGCCGTQQLSRGGRLLDDQRRLSQCWSLMRQLMCKESYVWVVFIC
jgi:hypothetical protein